MTEKPLDELYFVWLYSQVGSVSEKRPTRTYWNLAKLLYTREFAWTVANDDNRAEDGRDLRQEFADEQQIEITEPGWMRMSCDMLELLIGLSRRLAFEGEGEPSSWFWHLIENLELTPYHDAMKLPEPHINEVLDNVIWRQYEPDGRGGLFPLQHPQEDQRDVELWYQLCSYLLERT